MRRLAKIFAIALLLLLVVAGLTFWSLYSAATAEVPEYEALLEVDPVTADEKVSEFESRLSALYSDTQSQEEWSSRITADEINAWFARRLEEDFPSYAEEGLTQPRVMISEVGIAVAARSSIGSIQGVIMVRVTPFVTEEHELALEVASAKLGRLELPYEQFGEQLRRSPLEGTAPIRWSRGAGQLVVIVDPGRIDVGEGRRLRFVGVDLREGELLLRGAVDTLEPSGDEPPEPAL